MDALPTLAKYLAQLPRGIDSYPDAMLKGSIVRSTLIAAGVGIDWDSLDLPEAVRKLARQHPPVNAWVPEVHHVALTAVVFDCRFRDAGGLAAYAAWSFEKNRKLLQSPLYRMLFLLASAERAVVGAGKRWAAFHLGSSLTTMAHSPRSAEFEFAFPPGLFIDLGLHALEVTLRAAGEAAGGQNVRARHVVTSPDRARFILEWDG